MDNEKLGRHRWDIILIGGLVLIGAGIFLFLVLGSHGGSCAEIRIDGKVTQTLSLDVPSERTILTEGGENTVVIENGELYMKDADCPDGLCMNMGRISKSGQSIICLPHKLVIEITDSTDTDSSGDVDIIVK